jgi:hypothetical protein
MTEEEPPFSLDELPDPAEYSRARQKLEFLASHKGQGYTVRYGRHHDPENGVSDLVMHSPEGEWAGSVSHDWDGNISHFYVEKAHRSAIASLLLGATSEAERHGWAPPHKGGTMSPKAYGMAKAIMPNTTRMTGGNPRGNAISNYGD